MQIELRSDHVIIDGYVNAAGRDSRPIRCQTGDFVEQVEPGVFGKALKRAKNIKLLLNHRKDRELGSTAEGSLTLTEDSIGLRAHAVVTDEEVIRKARNKLLSGWSFGMYVNSSEMEQRSNAIPRRTLKDIDIFEVSIIDSTMTPYYAGTSVECRAEGEDVLAETRSFGDTAESVTVSDDYYIGYEEKLAQLRAECQWSDAEKKLAELRYNPYHDPTNGRFTGASGAGGGMLYVGKGQKGKGAYVVASEKFTNPKKTIPDLDNDLVRHANTASFLYDAGDAIKRNYEKNVEEINTLSLSDDEKQEAISKIHKLSEDELKSRSKAVSMYTAGPARKVSGADSALEKATKQSAEQESFMQSIRDKSKRNKKEAKDKEIFNVMKNAMDNGLLEVEIDGETWYRTRKSSKTWSKRAEEIDGDYG